MNKPHKPVRSLQRGLALIEAVSRRSEGANLKELAVEIGCSSAATYHLVQTLVEGGYLRRLESPVRYLLGDGLLRLVESQKKDRFYEVVHETMRQLVAQLPGASLSLTEAIGGNIVVSANVHATSPGAVLKEARHPLPPYASAGSLTHLAFWPPEVREEYRARFSFAAHGLAYWKSADAFEAALKTFREAGVFLMPGEPPLHLKLALPILRPGGSLAASLTIQWNQKERAGLARKRKQLTALALEAGAAITRQL
ncbi:MAG TPA: helix-turn-helix domain-containing protein [Chthoniobacteraceae bacterium]|nr:helix-turn-helix domain-containing protein [Chthoniobacteraceae bacterium]